MLKHASVKDIQKDITTTRARAIELDNFLEMWPEYRVTDAEGNAVWEMYVSYPEGIPLWKTLREHIIFKGICLDIQDIMYIQANPLYIFFI